MATETPESLGRLYERVVRQETYAGGVCPAEHTLVAFESGGLPADQRGPIAHHLNHCAGCRADYDAIAEAGEWFKANEQRILAGLADKAAAAGVQPWASCPSACVLRRYLDGVVGDSASAKALAAELEGHLAQCEHCADEADRYRAASGGAEISLLDLAANAANAALERLGNFLDELTAISQGRGAPAMVHAAPGYRSVEAPTIVAAVIGPDGTLNVDTDGRPAECRFEVVQADISGDGFLTVDLSTADRTYCSAAGKRFRAALTLRTDYVRLVLPETDIDAEGRVTFAGRLGQTVAVDPLPLSALDLTVYADQ